MKEKVKTTNNEEKELLNFKSKSIENNGIILGNFEDIPKYFQHNEYIKKGYRLNCNSVLKAFKSIFFLHNETVNIWSHLLGAIFFIFLIWYTSIFITNYKTLLKYVKQNLNDIEKIYKNIPNNVNDNMFSSLINNFNVFKYDFKYLKIDINNLYKSSFVALNDSYTRIISTIDTTSSNLQTFYNSFSEKFIELREKLLDLMELEYIPLERNNTQNSFSSRPPKRLRTWPLFIFLSSAIFCLSFSSIFHCIGNISPNFHRILSRFDYGGVCLLITGSCYPPYYYFFHCENKLKVFYLSFITVFGLTIFGLCLTNGFNLPNKRVLRGSSFLIFGISSGIPIIHMAVLGKNLSGYNNDTRFLFWYLGGITYIFGAILYLIRFPEKLFPGKFDFFGSSHQLLHISVLIAVIFHYIACLDAYYARFNNLC